MGIFGSSPEAQTSSSHSHRRGSNTVRTWVLWTPAHKNTFPEYPIGQKWGDEEQMYNNYTKSKVWTPHSKLLLVSTFFRIIGKSKQNIWLVHMWIYWFCLWGKCVKTWVKLSRAACRLEFMPVGGSVVSLRPFSRMVRGIRCSWWLGTGSPLINTL